MARVRLLSGPNRSGRSRAVNALLLERVDERVLIVPTRALAGERVDRLIAQGNLPGLLGSPVLTFQDFARQLLSGLPIESRMVSPMERRLLLESAIASLPREGALGALGKAAATEGFLSHLQRIIAGLKQAAVEPKEFQERVARRRAPSAMDAVVAEVYGAYQSALLESGSYDLQGMYWLARDACHMACPSALEGIEMVLLDGFDDFTPSEFRLIEAVAPHVGDLVFGLNYDPSPNRQDVYALTRDTANRIRTAFQAVDDTFDEEPAESYCHYASRHLFWRDRPSIPEGLDRNISIHACHDAVHEIETIAREIKALYASGKTRLSEVAVVFRDLTGNGQLLRDVFEEFGIPLHIQARLFLAESLAANFLLQLFDALDGWRRDAVVDVLVSPWFCNGNGTPPEYSGSFSFLAKSANIIGGSDSWHDLTILLAERLEQGARDEDKRSVEHYPHIVEACRRLSSLVAELRRIDETLPREASFQTFAGILLKLIGAGECDMSGALSSPALEAVREREGPALAELINLLDELSDWNLEGGTKISRSEFVRRFRNALQHHEFEAAGNDAGVACLDLQSVRGRRFDYVFLAGVNEGFVPQPPPLNAVYSDTDYTDLRAAGIRLEDSMIHARRELRLFHRIMDVARKRLCVTWRTVAGSDRPQLASPFIQDLRELFPELEVIEPKSHMDVLVPPVERIASPRDLGNWVFAAGADGFDLASPQFDRARTGTAIEKRRRSNAPCDTYDGVIAAGDLKSLLAGQFAEDRVFSVTQVEAYAECPFRFFLDRVLDVKAIETPDEAFDNRVRGTIFHDALESFHSRYRNRAVSDLSAEEAAETMEAIVAQPFDVLARRSFASPPGVGRVERVRVSEALKRYLRIERDRGEGHWKPSHFEVSFGMKARKEDDPLSRAEPFLLETKTGSVQFAGRIDRVDFADASARIIDYKSSVHMKVKEIQAGLVLQLTVYAQALEELLQKWGLSQARHERSGLSPFMQPDCAEAVYLEVGTKNFREALGKNKKNGAEECEERRKAAAEVVAESIGGMRAGLFAPAKREEICRFCPAERVCRFDRSRLERKGAFHG